ncbi:MAG TPA: Stp1/IreP family PP2C-type Ser/Thr phosphatase [Gaiellaceae bacterium]|nr:Stp1/IreP family PP2C-type Ser/Thr phosphatase [Gaiellaceae bacterium]
MRIGRSAGVTDTGRQRLRNEDAFVCEPPLFAVADGMGGARAGEVAARLAAAALEEAGTKARGAGDVVELIAEANRRIWERSVADPQTAGMGTTVTVALVEPASRTVTIGHVGDSRAYLLRDGAIEQLTTDHSLVAELVQGGVLTPEEAEHHPQRSAITRALGTEPNVEIDAFTVEAAPGDVFLLCSDGLSTMVADESVASVIEAADRDPARAAEALVAAANAEGGQDNVTVVLFELVEGEAEASEPEEDTGSGPVQDQTPPADAEARGSDAVEGENSGSISTHGAGPGGRLPALLFIVAILAVGALVLYWGISR